MLLRYLFILITNLTILCMTLVYSVHETAVVRSGTSALSGERGLLLPLSGGDQLHVVHVDEGRL